MIGAPRAGAAALGLADLGNLGVVVGARSGAVIDRGPLGAQRRDAGNRNDDKGAAGGQQNYFVNVTSTGDNTAHSPG